MSGEDSSECDPVRHRHRTEVLLPVNQRLSVISNDRDVRPASAPSSPLTPFRTIPGTLSSSVTFSVNSSASPKFYSKSRHYSLSHLPITNFFDQPRPGGSTLRFSVSPGTTIRLITGDRSRSPSNLVTVSDLLDMNYNRQMSTPVGPGTRPPERKTSLEVPPRPSSASPRSLRPSQAHNTVDSGFEDNNYLKALINAQMKGLQELIKVTQKWEEALESKRSYVGKLEKGLAFECSLGDAENSTDLRRYEKAQRLIKLRAEVRDLKVECLCLTQQVDLQGDHYLGDTELKPAPKKSNENGAPPVPPRPSPSVQVNRPTFGLLHTRVPPPSLTHRIQRPNQLQVTACVGQRPNPIAEERNTDSKWSCSACSFDNHPDLKKCEICETPKQSYSNLSEAIGGNQYVFYPVPVFYSSQTIATLDNFDHQQQENYFFVNNPFVDYAPVYALDNRTNNVPTNNISRDYDNNQVGTGEHRPSVATLLSCLSPSSCSSHTNCYCHKQK